MWIGWVLQGCARAGPSEKGDKSEWPTLWIMSFRLQGFICTAERCDGCTVALFGPVLLSPN